MKKKIMIFNFHLFEREQLCEYFHDMANKGWMLKKLRYGWITFASCESQDVSFVIDIYPHGSYLDPYAVDEKEILYGDMVEEYGYECICRYSNYQIFKYEKDVIPIHDEESAEQIKVQHRAIIKFELINHVMFLLLAVMIWMNLTMLLRVDTFLNDGKVMAILLEAVMAVLFFIRAVPSLLWFMFKDRYHVSYKHILLREQCLGILSSVVIFLLIIALYFMTQSNLYVIPIFLAPFFSIFAYYLIKLVCKRWFKQHYVLISFVLTLLLTMQVFLRMIPLSIPLNSHTSASVGELTRSDIRDISGERTSIYKREESSTFLSMINYNEEYLDTTQVQNETDPATEYFEYELYTIHDTPLSSYISSLIIDVNDPKIKLVDTTDDFQWYCDPYDQQFLIVGSHIVIMQTNDLTTGDISIIIDKLHLKE